MNPARLEHGAEPVPWQKPLMHCIIDLSGLLMEKVLRVFNIMPVIETGEGLGWPIGHARANAKHL